MNEIFYIDERFREEGHDHSLLDFYAFNTVSVSGKGVVFISLLGLAMLLWGYSQGHPLHQIIYDELSDVFNSDPNQINTQATLLGCKVSKEPDVSVYLDDYRHSLYFTWIVKTGTNTYQRYYRSATFWLEESRCITTSPDHRISIQFDRRNPFSSFVTDSRWRDDYRRSSEFLMAALTYLGWMAVGLFIFLMPPVVYTHYYRKWRKLVNEGVFIRGTLDEFREQVTRVKSDTIIQYIFRYRFQSPTGKTITGKQHIYGGWLTSEQFPQPGTPIYVLYAHDKCHVMI